jgi:hypothetical protein
VQQGVGVDPYRRRLRADSNFFLELQFCNEHGLPHSEFLHWDPVDRAKAISFVVEKAERCVMCGTAQWEWDADRFAYEPVEKRCPGCYAKDVVAEDSGRNPGVSIELLPSTGREAAIRQVRAARREAARKAKR